MLLADFDPDVVGIAAQPLLVRDADRRHVPDFLRADRSVLIVNVKVPERLGAEEVADALSWAGRLPSRYTDLTLWPSIDATGQGWSRMLRLHGVAETGRHECL